MAAERVAREHDDVDGKHQRADADAERLTTGLRVWEPQGEPYVVGEDHEEEDGDVREVAVYVLQHQREPALAAIMDPARFTDSTRSRSGPERLVVRPAVVVARESKKTGERQDDQRGRKRQQRGPPRRLGTEPRMRRIAPDHRRVERGNIRAMG